MEKTHSVPAKQATIELKKAQEEDIPTICGLTLEKNLLPRSAEEVRALLHYYHVAVNVETGGIVGCISAKVYGADAEIISFRVQEKFGGRGIGMELIKRQLQCLSGQAEISRIFALTTREVATRIFLKAGFIEVGIQLFGPKVLSDCAQCPKNFVKNGRHLCDEIAVIYKPS